MAAASLEAIPMIREWSDASMSGHTTTAAAERAADELLASIKSTFSDPEFDANAVNLGAKHAKVVMIIVKGRKKTKKTIPISWIRPTDIVDDHGKLGSAYTILDDSGSTGANSVIQRALGACWLQSALAATAERPEYLRNVIRTAHVQANGCYQVRLCIGGAWSVVTIDDRIPCDAEFSRMAFTRGPGRQLWVPFVEKACAKVAGSYSGIEGGHISQGLRLLTGAPATQFHIAVCATNEELKVARAKHTAAEMVRRSSSPGGTILPRSLRVKGSGRPPPVSATGPPAESTVNAVWVRLQQYHELGYIMGASCGVDVNTVALEPAALKRLQAEATAAGLSTRHAYSILEVQTHKGARLIRLRNPWGHGGWKGKYSRGWEGWDEADKEALYPAEPKAGGATGGGGGVGATVDAAVHHGGSRATGSRRVVVKSGKVDGDGTFIMAVSDFCKYFGVVDLAVTREGWWHARRTTHLPQGAEITHWPAYRVEAASMDAAIEMTVAVLQPSDRLMGWWDSHIENSPALISDGTTASLESEPVGLLFKGGIAPAGSGAAGGGGGAASSRRVAVSAAAAAPGTRVQEERRETPVLSGSPPVRRTGGTRRVHTGRSGLTQSGMARAGGAMGGIADLYGALEGDGPSPSVSGAGGGNRSVHRTGRPARGGSRTGSVRTGHRATSSHASAAATRTGGRAHHSGTSQAAGSSAVARVRVTAGQTGARGTRTRRTVGAHSTGGARPTPASGAGATTGGSPRGQGVKKTWATVKLNRMTDIGLAVVGTTGAEAAASADPSAALGTEDTAGHGDTVGSITLLQHARRETHDSVLLQHTIPTGIPNKSTVIMPLGFGQLTRWQFATDKEKELRPSGAPITVQCLSSSPVRLVPIQVPMSVVAATMIQRCVQHGVRMVVPTGPKGASDDYSGVYQLTNDSMCVVALVNASASTSLTVTVGEYSGQNVWFSRGHSASAGVGTRSLAGTGARGARSAKPSATSPSSHAVASTTDTLEPGSCMVIQIASQDQQFGTSGFAFKNLGVSMAGVPKGAKAEDNKQTREKHVPEVRGGLHSVLSTSWLFH